MDKPAQLTLPAELANLSAFKAFIIEELDRFGLDSPKCLQVELACDELLTNCINYAYPKTPGDITIRCQAIAGDSLQIRIIDAGVRFDPLATEAPDLSLDLDQRPMGGLGIMLSREMVDDISYERRRESNIITITKNKK